MHDATTLLEPMAASRLARRGHVLDSSTLASLEGRRRALIGERDGLRAALKAASPKLDRGEQQVSKKRLKALEEELRDCELRLREMLLAIPNLPADEAPDGGPADPAVEVERWGEPPEAGAEPRDHLDLGTALGILEPSRAAKLSGARFAVTQGTGARLERALVSFFLDLHTQEHGYTEYGVPHLVTRETMTGTGQLPKFAEDLFATTVAGRDMLLIPTAEVPLVNLYRDEIVSPGELPLRLTAHTPCYRGEAGSYGRDTRGLIRLHQFEKVELVRICHPEQAAAELELLRGHAEACLQRLGLHYRVVELRAGDLGFAARRTYDLEVWLPSQGRYREISSCSDCGDFQGRRAGIRIREGNGRKVFAATLNGSGLPIGRTFAALLEQNQRPDGSVAIPPALVPYTGFSAISPNGEPRR